MEALLVIDMLNDFVHPGAPLEVPDARSIIPVVRAEIDAAHAQGRPVFYICDAHDPEDRDFAKFNRPRHAVRGSKGADVVDELKPSPGDVIVRKKSYSGFYLTILDAALKGRGVSSVRLTGEVTHICILFTASDAVLRGYAVTVVENGVAGLGREDHEAALRIMRDVLRVNVVKSSVVLPGKQAA